MEFPRPPHPSQGAQQLTVYNGLKRVILVTGDRWWNDQRAIRLVLSGEDKRTVVMHGGASGADSVADLAALELGMPRCKIPYFGVYRQAGGPFRNSFMLALLVGLKEQGWEVKVIAFHDNLKESKGTKDMVMKATKAGLKVKRYAHKA